MTDNKDLKYTQQFKPYTEIREVQYVEQQDLYPDLGYEDVSSQRGYGPCNKSGCTHTFQLTVNIVNSSGRGVGPKAGDGECTVILNSVSEARIFCSQVRGDWVANKGVWSPSSSSGAGYITEGKRNTIAKDIEGHIASFESHENDLITPVNHG